MKYFNLFPLILLLFLLGSCVKSNPLNCTKKLEALSQAADRYSQDQSQANCRLYYQALKDYVNSNACAGDIFYKSYQEEFNQSTEDDFCN
ncbi:MAG TPA: hypothetical protein P5275_08470 [Saprospiraceae bacterium]|nr:hypothetical protein [Saprospiraceae bacterium]MCB9270324.1 hypothetical protein [Lewinellaceae bacterium]HPG08482.1 hypothetical protein [Saprospiraceae bacterium]HQU54574.1 hypothetical protein [Saprospiraceae bacterium]HRV84880.1 hypothetical protein [Saprospiraceae bacterium]